MDDPKGTFFANCCLSVSAVPPRPCTVLANMDEFRVEVKQVYDRKVAMLKDAILNDGKEEEDREWTPDIISIMRTCHIELDTPSQESMYWLRFLQPPLVSAIRSLALGKRNVLGR